MHDANADEPGGNVPRFGGPPAIGALWNELKERDRSCIRDHSREANGHDFLHGIE